ncbi:Acg family FMN-binding oxidoreductase [Streptomyces somaliensis]|uniref:Acg family FMN-binding oxidoreductase n=1 Tax=Streptomyces somaliensis TaxID=78355 RepID=UPI003F752941
MTAPAPDATSLTSWVADAVLAPSMHNAQPWRFRYERASGLLALRMDPARAMPRSDPSARGLHLGCGAALFNLRVAAADAGWEARIEARPEPDDPLLLARVAFAPAPDRDAVADLRPAVPRRRTSREPFGGETVPGPLLDGLRGAARAEGAHLDFADDWRVGDLLGAVWDAERAEELSPEVREEIARWTADRDGAAPEGIPSYALGPRRYDGRAPVAGLPPAPTGTGTPCRRSTSRGPAWPCWAPAATAPRTGCGSARPWSASCSRRHRTGCPPAQLAGPRMAGAALAGARPAVGGGLAADPDPPRLRPRGPRDAAQAGGRGPRRPLRPSAPPGAVRTAGARGDGARARGPGRARL